MNRDESVLTFKEKDTHGLKLLIKRQNTKIKTHNSYREKRNSCKEAQKDHEATRASLRKSMKLKTKRQRQKMIKEVKWTQSNKETTEDRYNDNCKRTK